MSGFLRRAPARLADWAYGVRYAIGGVVGFIVLWQLLAMSGRVQSEMLPTFTSVAKALWDNRQLLWVPAEPSSRSRRR